MILKNQKQCLIKKKDYKLKSKESSVPNDEFKNYELISPPELKRIRNSGPKLLSFDG